MRSTTCLAMALLAAALTAGCGTGGEKESTSTSTSAAAAPGAVAGTTTTTLRYEVTGMHCDGCAQAIVAEVMEIPGVAKVTCTYESHAADIVVNDPALRGKVEHAITKLGYTIAPLAAGADAAASSK